MIKMIQKTLLLLGVLHMSACGMCGGKPKAEPTCNKKAWPLVRKHNIEHADV